MTVLGREWFEKRSVGIVGGNVNGFSRNQDILGILVPFFNVQSGLFVLKVTPSDMKGGKGCGQCVDDFAGGAVDIVLVMKIIPYEAFVKVVNDRVGKEQKGIKVVEDTVLHPPRLPMDQIVCVPLVGIKKGLAFVSTKPRNAPLGQFRNGPILEVIQIKDYALFHVFHGWLVSTIFQMPVQMTTIVLFLLLMDTPFGQWFQGG